MQLTNHLIFRVFAAQYWRNLNTFIYSAACSVECYWRRESWNFVSGICSGVAVQLGGPVMTFLFECVRLIKMRLPTRIAEAITRMIVAEIQIEYRESFGISQQVGETRLSMFWLLLSDVNM